MEQLDSKKGNSFLLKGQTRQQKLNEIDALYKSQINKINQDKHDYKPNMIKNPEKINTPKNLNKETYISYRSNKNNQEKIVKPLIASGQKIINDNLQKYQFIGSSKILQSQSSRTIQILRKEIQIKQLKIRDLSNMCQQLVEKLNQHLQDQEKQNYLKKLKQNSDKKMERLQNLLKIKNQQIFFKMKLQMVSLLQQFQIPKEQVSGINQMINESMLFSFFVRKIKNKIKQIKSKQQYINIEQQKDKVVNEKHQERIHYLLETNELLKLSQQKLKSKNDDLRNQLDKLVEKIKDVQLQSQQKQNELFRIKKQYEQLRMWKDKASNIKKVVESQTEQQKKIYQNQQKQMKILLNNYCIQKRKLQTELQQKQTFIEQMLIKVKLLQQQNQKLNREYIRWKQRYEWLQRQKQIKYQQFQQEKEQLIGQFEIYKQSNNPSLNLTSKKQAENALKMVEQYRQAYHQIVIQLQQQRIESKNKKEQLIKKNEILERQYKQKYKKLSEIKQKQIVDLSNDFLIRQKNLRNQFEKKQKLIQQKMEAKNKVLLAQQQRKRTQSLIFNQNEKEQLKKQLKKLHQVLQVKQQLINVLNYKNNAKIVNNSQYKQQTKIVTSKPEYIE